MLDSETAMQETSKLVAQWWGDWHREFRTDELDYEAVRDLAYLVLRNIQMKSGLSPDNPVPAPEGWDDWGY